MERFSMKKIEGASICIVLWWLICIFLIIDTGLFIYPSLSQTLIGNVFILLLSLVGWLHGIISPQKVRVHLSTILVFCWFVYLCFHAAVIANAENYKLLYHLSCLFFMLTLSQMLHNGLLTFRKLENGFLLVLIIQLVCLLLQSMGLMSSYNPFFSLTGFSDNPNATAIMIAVCIPLIYERLKTSNHTFFLLTLLVISFVFLIVLKCRTSYIGLAVICMVRIILSAKAKKFYHQTGKKVFYCICTIFVLCLFFISLSLYRMKQDSSDGRLLVWNISTVMLTEKPEGWGIGMFERYYNLRQGDYFAKGEYCEREQMLASTVYMAYNDFLEHGVEAGWGGSFFLFLFYVMLSVQAYKARKIVAFSVICAFIIMSFVNFIYATIQPWFILLCYASNIITNEKDFIKLGDKMSKSIQVVALLISGLLLGRYVELTLSQMSLRHAEKMESSGHKIEVKDVENLSNHIGTSEGYYKFLAFLNMRDGEYSKAVDNLNMALNYTSEPRFFFDLFNCYDKMGLPEQGIQYVEIVRNMLPQNMTSRNILLKWYDSQGMYEMALNIAYEMIKTPLKVNNPAAERYQQGARWYIETHL